MFGLFLADTEVPLSKTPKEHVDVLICCGDLSDKYILRVAEHCSCTKVFAVRGNHDPAASFPEPIVDLHLVTRRIGEVRFGGFSGCLRYKPRGNHLYSQEEVGNALHNFPTVDIFVTHNSPLGVHDKPHDEAHEGFRAFGHYIERCHPRFLVHGHQHRNCQTLVGSTLVIGVYGWRLFDLT